MFKKKTLSAIIIAITMLAMPFTAQAQFGKLLKKANKAIDKVNNALSTTEATNNSNDAPKPQAKAMTQANGVEVLNPLASVVDIELIGFYGKSTSLNYGQGYVAFKIKMKANENTIGIGNAGSYGAIAVDQDGNTYKWSQGITSAFNVAEGLFTKVFVKGQYNYFEDVKKSATNLQLLRLYFHVDANHKEYVTFKNVPVIWDQDPE